jgi:hypothetical protein
MSSSESPDRTTIVVGASRGLGRGIATTLAQAGGGTVVAVARDQAALAGLANAADTIVAEVADATDPTVASGLLDRHDPQAIVLVAGASPSVRPLQGSPLTGGYAGAKATQRFIAAYAQEEADRAGLDIKFAAILPRITPLTELGRPAVGAYAVRAGQTEDEYMAKMGPPVTPETAGAAVLELLQTDAASLGLAYLLTGAGIKQLP